MTLGELLTVEVASFGGDFDLLPEARTPGLWNRERVDEALAWAGRLAGQPDLVLPYSAFRRFALDGDRQEYETAYFHRRRRLEVFALAVLSDRGFEFLGPLENVLAAVCDEFTWALPAHLAGHPDPATVVDLFAAETASALAEIRALLGGRLSTDLAARIEAEVRRRVLGPYLADRTPWDWESAPHNWAAVCGGGVGIAALWLETDPLVLARVLGRLGPTFDAYLSGFPADGLCLEGMGYWTYGFGYFIAFAELLKDRTRGSIDLLGHPDLALRLKAIAAFPSVGRLGRRAFARFSDALAEYRYPPGVVRRLAERLGWDEGLPAGQAEDLAFDPCVRWVRHLRDVVWAPGASNSVSGSITAPEEPSALWFADSQWLVVHGALGGVPVGLAAKAGHNAEPHNHNDVGSFHMVAGDDFLLDDLGAGRYDRGYFGPERYQYFVNSSRSHSLPLIGHGQEIGQGQKPGRKHEARSVVFEHQGSHVRWSADLAPAYGLPAHNSVVRTLEIDTNALEHLRVADAFSLKGAVSGPREVRERFITRLPVSWVGSSARVDGAEFTLTLTPTVEPQSWEVVSEAFSPHRGPDQVVFCIDFVYLVSDSVLNLGFDLYLQKRTPDDPDQP